MIPFGVQDAKDNDVVAFETVEKFVGETDGEQTTEAAIVNGAALWVFLQQMNRVADFLQQFITQPYPPRLIPVPRFPRVRLRVGPDDDAPAHGRVGLRSRASTSSHVEPA